VALAAELSWPWPLNSFDLGFRPRWPRGWRR